MERIPKDKAVSERLKGLIEHRYPSRGRFGELESVSGINANRWKNFFYRKQEATQEMVLFWCKKYPDNADWLLTGIEAPEQKSFPFAARVPKRWEGQTVADRLNWVITEWAAPSGEQLFNYLEEKSGGRIPASDWARVVLRADQPTVDMIAVVSEYRPYFTEWVITGGVSKMQVDPSDRDSIECWTKMRRDQWGHLEKTWDDSKKDNNDDQTS